MKIQGHYIAKLLKMGKITDTKAMGAYGETVLRIAATCSDCAFLGNCDGAVDCPIIRKELSTTNEKT